MGFVDTELIKLFGDQTTAHQALLGAEPSIQPAISQPEKWIRAGGECYILPFELKNEQKSIRGIFKAVLSNGGNVDIPVSRRKLLETNGMRTPHLYGYGGGVILEEFLPYNFDEALQKFGDIALREVAYAYGVIAKCGFQPVTNGLIRDFRANESGKMHMIDFGGDLGEPSSKPTELWGAFEKELNEKYGISNNIIKSLYKYYKNGLESPKKATEIALTKH